MSDPIKERDLPLVTPAPTDEVRVLRNGRSVRAPVTELPTTTEVQARLDLLQLAVGSGMVPYSTAGSLPGSDPGAGNRVAIVWNDSTASNNGVYIYSGGWQKSKDQTTLLWERVATKAAGGVPGKNLLDTNAAGVQTGQLVSAANGALSSNSGFNTSDYIAIKPSTDYSFNRRSNVAFYNSSKTFISGDSTSTTLTLGSPAGAAFMRVSVPVGAWNLAQVEEGSEVTSFEPFRETPYVEPAALKDGSVTPEKTTLFAIGKNLFNKDDPEIEVGKFISNTTGALSSNATYNTTGYIKITPGVDYYGAGASHGIRFSAFYNAAKGLISGGTSTEISTFEAPAGAEYIRFSYYASDHATFQLEEGTSATAYEPYYNTINPINNAPVYVQPKPGSLSAADLADQSIEVVKTAFIKLGKNLFNPATITAGQFINPANGALTANSTFNTSDFIPVKPSTTYYAAVASGARGVRFGCFFTAAKTVISGGPNDNTGQTFTFTTPSNCYWVRLTCWASDTQGFQVEEGAEKTGFVPYRYEMDLPGSAPLHTGPGSDVSPWAGKVWGALGDSITAGATWQGYVAGALGLLHSNYGSGGTKISGDSSSATAMCQDTRINAIPESADLITLMGGTNDWAQNVPLGDEDSTDPEEFFGALNTFAQKAFTRWPEKRIVIATTPYGEIVDYVSRGWSDPAHNSLGLTTNDYAEAVRIACRRNNIACIDVARDGGWGAVNLEAALGGDEEDHLHPAMGSNAAKGIARAFIAGLKALEPL